MHNSTYMNNWCISVNVPIPDISKTEMFFDLEDYSLTEQLLEEEYEKLMVDLYSTHQQNKDYTQLSTAAWTTIHNDRSEIDVANNISCLPLQTIPLQYNTSSNIWDIVTAGEVSIKYDNLKLKIQSAKSPTQFGNYSLWDDVGAGNWATHAPEPLLTNDHHYAYGVFADMKIDILKTIPSIVHGDWVTFRAKLLLQDQH